MAVAGVCARYSIRPRSCSTRRALILSNRDKVWVEVISSVEHGLAKALAQHGAGGAHRGRAPRPLRTHANQRRALMSARHRWFLRGGLALLAALYWGADGRAAVVPIMGLGDQKEEEEAPKDSVVSDSTITESLKQRLLFMPFSRQVEIQGRVGHNTQPSPVAWLIRCAAVPFSVPCLLIRHSCG